MAERAILRRQNDLPTDVRALLHGPSPADAWHLPSHPQIGNPFRVASRLSQWMLFGTMGLWLMMSHRRVRWLMGVAAMLSVSCAHMPRQVASPDRPLPHQIRRFFINADVVAVGTASRVRITSAGGVCCRVSFTFAAKRFLKGEDDRQFVEVFESRGASDASLRQYYTGELVFFYRKTASGDTAQRDSIWIAAGGLDVEGLMASPQSAGPATSLQAPLCAPAETVVFACRIGATPVSVCAAGDASPRRGYLEYRVGDAKLPAGHVPPPRSATGASVTFSGGGGAWMRFHDDAFAYVVYTAIGKWGPKGEVRAKQGVTVERDGQAVADLACGGSATSILGAGWFGTVGVVANGEDFDFPIK